MNNNRDRQRPKPYHHGDLRNALIQAGLELLSEGGAAALDLRKVARRASVSHAAPYRHFPDKQALIAAINEEGFHRVGPSLTQDTCRAERACDANRKAASDRLAHMSESITLLGSKVNARKRRELFLLKR